MATTILLIEDEAAIADTLLYALGKEGWQVQWHTLGTDGVRAVQETPFDLVLLDVGLPDGSGFEFCRQIRRYSDVPLVFLTARNEEVDRIVGLELGADDYVAKPFSPREVCARIRTILRRARPQGAVTAAPATVAQPAALLEIDKEGGRVRYSGQWLLLTRYELLLLQALAHRPGRIYSRAQLMDLVWTDADALDRTVDTHIKTLRAKLREVDSSHEPIVTHRGLGYSLQWTP